MATKHHSDAEQIEADVDDYGFKSITLAIQTLRRGKQDKHWFNAARFLIKKAAPDVKLLLEAQDIVTRQDYQEEMNQKVSAHHSVLMSVFVKVAVAFILVGIGVVGTLLYEK